jgi:hypothetical protein
MPIIVELQFEDGTSQKRRNSQFKFGEEIMITAKRVFATEKKVVKIQLDPKLETADIDVTNNYLAKRSRCR